MTCYDCSQISNSHSMPRTDTRLSISKTELMTTLERLNVRDIDAIQLMEHCPAKQNLCIPLERLKARDVDAN